MGGLREAASCSSRVTDRDEGEVLRVVGGKWEREGRGWQPEGVGWL